MPNMSLTKNAMPHQDAEVRARNFHEVALGYTEELALAEAERCLNCKHMPCVSGCPVNVRIPEFISKIKEGDFEAAYQIIHDTSSLPAVCGRVCPQETQCESKCVRGIKGEPVAIGRLERFVADWHNEHSQETPEVPAFNGHKVAVVGSGPSGLTCAGDLAKLGYKVTVYEALHTAGGVLVYGIPEFRLPKAIVQKEVDHLSAMGVDVETNMVIGKTLTVDELFEMGNEAVYIASGAGLPNFMNIPGEAYKGVYSANEFLTRSNLMKSYLDNPVTPIMKGGKVAVVGGGNVAMDAARTALRLGAEKVYIIYRRSLEELPARKEEVEHAMEEGVDFQLLNNPVEILGYINNHYYEDLTLETVSEKYYLSTYYFSRTFKQVTGFHFVEYLSNVRIKEAKKLLLNSTYTVNEISSAVGFHSNTHFGRVFKQIVGCSPSAYKKKELP